MRGKVEFGAEIGTGSWRCWDTLPFLTPNMAVPSVTKTGRANCTAAPTDRRDSRVEPFRTDYS